MPLVDFKILLFVVKYFEITLYLDNSFTGQRATIRNDNPFLKRGIDFQVQIHFEYLFYMTFVCLNDGITYF